MFEGLKFEVWKFVDWCGTMDFGWNVVLGFGFWFLFGILTVPLVISSSLCFSLHPVRLISAHLISNYLPHIRRLHAWTVLSLNILRTCP